MTADRPPMPPLPSHPRPHSEWRHRKGGEYVVIMLAYIEATREPAVVYLSRAGGQAWVRPLGEFLDGRFTEIASPASHD